MLYYLGWLLLFIGVAILYSGSKKNKKINILLGSIIVFVSVWLITPSNNELSIVKTIASLTQWCIVGILTAFGIFGALLVIYGYFKSENNNLHWPFLDENAEKVSNSLTIFGVLLTSLSIYIPQAHTPEEPSVFSFLISAPFVIVLCVFYIARFKNIESYIVNGLAILGLSGTILRLVKTSELWEILRRFSS